MAAVIVHIYIVITIATIILCTLMKVAVTLLNASLKHSTVATSLVKHYFRPAP